MGEGTRLERARRLIRLLGSTLFAVLLLTSPARALTASDLISSSRKYLRDTSPDTARQRFSDVDLVGFLNEAQQEMVTMGTEFPGVLASMIYLSSAQQCYPYTTLTGTGTLVNVPIQITGVWINQIRLSQVTLPGEFWSNNTDWTVALGTPTLYFLRREPNGAPDICFWPTYASTATVPTMITFNQTRTMTSCDSANTIEQSSSAINGCNAGTFSTPVISTTTPTLDVFQGASDLVPFEHLLAFYVAYRGWLINGRPDLATEYQKLWATGIVSMKTIIYTMPDYRPGMIGLNRQNVSPP